METKAVIHLLLLLSSILPEDENEITVTYKTLPITRKLASHLACEFLCHLLYSRSQIHRAPSPICGLSSHVWIRISIRTRVRIGIEKGEKKATACGLRKECPQISI